MIIFFADVIKFLNAVLLWCDSLNDKGCFITADMALCNVNLWLDVMRTQRVPANSGQGAAR